MANRRYIIGIGVAVGVMAVASAFLVATPAKTSTKAAKATGAKSKFDESELLARIDRLTSKVSALTARVERCESDPTENRTADSGNSRKNHDEEPQHPDPASERARAVTRLTGITQSFEHEPRDTAWAGEMESTLEDAFRKGNHEGTTMLQIACRTTTCKMDVQHEDQTSSLRFERILQDVPGNYYMQHLDSSQTGGKPRTITFFVRSGREANSVVASSMAALTASERPR